MTDDKERFVRWQSIYREHFSYAVNLFLTLSTASLGYCYTLIRDKTFGSTWLFWASLFLIWASTAFGVACVLNRLQDFRGTAQRARRSDTALEKSELADLGVISRVAFYVQVATFVIGVTLLGFAILVNDRFSD